MIASKLQLLADTKEALRVKLELDTSVPFDRYVKEINDSPSNPPIFSNDINGKLARIAYAKEQLRLALNLDLNVPFSRYVDYVNLWSPKVYFANNEHGAWYDPSDLTTLFIDAQGTTPVTSAGDPVGLMLDKSGNNVHARQLLSAYRPIYRIDEYGNAFLDSKNGGYMNIDASFDFLVTRTGASLAMALGKMSVDIASVIGNDSVRLANRGFGIYLDDRDSSNPMMLNHTNPYDGLVNSPRNANMISGTNPYVINYKQTNANNFWGSTIKPFESNSVAGSANGHNMVILAAGGEDGVKLANGTPDFYGMVVVDKAIDDFTRLNEYLLAKTGGVL